MYKGLLGLATGYLVAWTLNTKKGRKTAINAGKTVLRQCGNLERQVTHIFKQKMQAPFSNSGNEKEKVISNEEHRKDETPANR